ncbi:MAG: phosphotyrosine protein phosphatase [Dactylosporangium sp.]|nr:phosphotyrosine protein phosphatase [Dactylosporangium sp.]NNJ60805.1 phosphotyrosine protein phosphatase [Dactylosporangium sp.]
MPPFTVLHVCMGNICRSPMAERLLVVAAERLVGDKAGQWLHVHGAGTGGWHHGDRMDPGAARQVRQRGGDPDRFRARRLLAEHVEASDLILTATGEQVEFVERLVPDADGRTFALGEFGRLLRAVDADRLPPFAANPDGVYARGVALVAAVDAARAGRGPTPADDLDDPWSRGERVFSRVADEIEQTVVPLAGLLLGGPDAVGR